MPRLQLDIVDVRQLPLLHGTTIPEEYLDIMGHMNVMWSDIARSLDDLIAEHGKLRWPAPICGGMPP